MMCINVRNYSSVFLKYTFTAKFSGFVDDKGKQAQQFVQVWWYAAWCHHVMLCKPTQPAPPALSLCMTRLRDSCCIRVPPAQLFMCVICTAVCWHWSSRTGSVYCCTLADITGDRGVTLRQGVVLVCTFCGELLTGDQDATVKWCPSSIKYLHKASFKCQKLQIKTVIKQVYH